MNFSDKIAYLDFLNIASEVAAGENFQIYLVGGFVRDLLLERKNEDIDFLVVGSGTGFASKLADRLGVSKVVTFKNFGTAHFFYDKYELEFVGARKESYDKDSRKPMVEDGTFLDDISRRDFTINTMAISLNKGSFGELVDTYNGLEDLQNKIIRTPLDPFVTFSDDPLRIMRAYRFAATLNLTLDDSVLVASTKMKERLKIVSQERITDEFLKLLASPKPSIGLKQLFYAGIMEIIFPEFANLAGVEQKQDFHHKDVFLHTCQVVDNIAQVSDNIWLRFAALVHDIAKPATKRFVEGTGWTFHGHEDLGAKMLKGIFRRMKLPFSQLEYVQKLVRLHLRPIALVDDIVTDSAIRRMVVQAGEDLNDLITLCRADITSKNPDKVSKYLDNYERVMKKVFEVEEKDKLRAFQSPVRGEEIMSICGLKPGKRVGVLKDAIEEAILDGVIPNTYEDALAYLYKIKDTIE